jgi:16S rRNA (adenine1518-N6/adenine1519-N6)-dimethyltransferase
MKPNYNSAAELRAFLESRGLGMRKKYGQNFLINPAARNALVDALAAETGSEVWEIGPGLGAMTALLLERGLLVRAFEIDSGFAAVLKQLFGEEKNFTLVEGDVLKTWPLTCPASLNEKAAPYLLGNLPYNIAAALLADFIEQGRHFRRMVITVQREVALRMTAAPGQADYSSFSVLCATAYTVKPLMLIKGASFYPRPNVDSRGVLLELKKDLVPPPPLFYPLLRALFASRRKMIKNNLENFLAGRGGNAAAEETARAVLSRCGLTGNERAETLECAAFAALAKALEDMRK